MPNLEIKDLSVKVGTKEILNNLNLNINSGEIHAIMGPNGTGKSTLSKVIMGNDLYEIESGKIIFDNKEINDLTPDIRAKMGIFLAMQNPVEIEGVTNADFLRTALHEKEGKSFKLMNFIKDLNSNVKKLKINDEAIHRDINVNFSGGEKKKNEILQMYMLKPSLIILDEIDSGLDMDSLKIIGNMVMDYFNEFKPAILMITHYQRLLDYINPDYIHIMKDGKIIKSGDIKLVSTIEEKGYDYFNDLEKIETTVVEEN